MLAALWGAFGARVVRLGRAAAVGWRGTMQTMAWIRRLGGLGRDEGGGRRRRDVSDAAARVTEPNAAGWVTILKARISRWEPPHSRNT